MDELRELYQQVILDHNKNPKNFGKLENSSHASEGYNPLCGDKINVYLNIESGVIKDIRFEGIGCAISKASASVMTTMLKEKTVEEAEVFFKIFLKSITAEGESEPDVLKSLGKLAVFTGVKEFPSRVKCASLAWHTMLAAMKEDARTVSTE